MHPVLSFFSRHRTTVFVGLSGGVDSAVSAALLQRQGYRVVGAFIRIALPGYPCSAGEDRRDALRVAAHLGIPFREIDLSEEYRVAVFDETMRSYARGETPNPDTLCNREIKFGIFFDWAMKQGADLVATGHYARTSRGKLYMSADLKKDQSYFLWAVPSAKLRKTLFPVGGFTKEKVRKLAARFKLPNSERPDSQGLCFLGGVDIADALAREIEITSGDVYSPEGDRIGRHSGVALYTLGQRHGFTLNPDVPKVPHYVIRKDTARNSIVVSPLKRPTGHAGVCITLREPNWIGPVRDGSCKARFRYRQALMPAFLRGESGEVELFQPHYVPEGQSLVLYRGTRCLGGGIIDTLAV